MTNTGRAWIRHGTTLLIVGFLVAVAVIGYERSLRHSPSVGGVDAGEVGLDLSDVAIGLYRGFRHTETIKGKPAFILNSLRTLSRASGWQEIEVIRLELFNDDGEPGPVVTSERASFNIETRETRLEGGIHVEFPNGAFLNTEAGEYRSKAHRFESKAPVLYVDGGTFGQAERASYSLKDDRVRLEGSAVFRTEDGIMLQSARMAYRRDERKVFFSQGVVLTQGLTRLSAPRATVLLAPDEGPPQKIELLGGVKAVTTMASSETLVEMAAERVISVRDAQGNWQVNAWTDGPWIEIRFTGGPDFYERSLQTMRLMAVVAPEGIISLQTQNGVCLEEIPMEADPKTAQAMTGRVWFDAGRMTDVELDGAVEIRTAGIEGQAQRVRLVQRTGMVILQGDATGRNRVRVTTERGWMDCEQANLFDLEDRLEARGQVHGELRDARLFGSGELPEDGEPVRFAGERLEVTGEGDQYTLHENARIWQGDRLLLADEVEYLHDNESVRARGHVRASFPAEEMDPDATADEGVVVDSRSLDYHAADRRAIFRGSVRYSDPKHSLSANRLTVEFDEASSVSDVEAEGAVEINDLVTGRRLTGQHARRDVESETIEVTGSPAQLTDEKGNVASGSSLTWNQADGTVSIGGGTELIYYPEEEP